jgi:hypothetical protein
MVSLHGNGNPKRGRPWRWGQGTLATVSLIKRRFLVKILLSRDWWDLKVGYMDLSNVSLSRDPPESMGTATHVSHERSLQATVRSYLSLSINTRLVLWPLISSNKPRGELWNRFYGSRRRTQPAELPSITHTHANTLRNCCPVLPGSRGSQWQRCLVSNHC